MSFRIQLQTKAAWLFLLAVWACWPAASSSQTPEMRGMWVTRFEWPNNQGDVVQMQSRIATTMETLAKNNFNAVYFQIRGQADALYPSPYEPWSRQIGYKDPGSGFDPMAFAIQEARKHGLEFHAYINPFPCWDLKDQSPPDPNHLFNARPDWLSVDGSGKPVFSEYYYLNPANPLVHAHVRTVIMDIVNRYDVDGIHLDRIRYPGTTVSRDPATQARFNGLGNPGKLKWEDWLRAQITGFLNDLYGQIAAVNPRVKVTAAVWGIYDRTAIPGYGGFSSGFHQYYQDSLAWARLGVMDALVPMIYWAIGGRKPDYDELYSYFLAHGAGRHVYGGLQTKFDDLDEPIRQIQYTRSVGGHGIVGFSYSGVDARKTWDRYRAAYPQKVPTPTMPWKSDPTTGNILGVVKTPDGRPVVDAWVRLVGVEAVWLSSGDGLFSLLHLPPGFQYTVTAEHPEFGRASLSGVRVVSATTTPLELVLGAGGGGMDAGANVAPPSAPVALDESAAGVSFDPGAGNIGNTGDTGDSPGGSFFPPLTSEEPTTAFPSP